MMPREYVMNVAYHEPLHIFREFYGTIDEMRKKQVAWAAEMNVYHQLYTRAARRCNIRYRRPLCEDLGDDGTDER